MFPPIALTVAVMTGLVFGHLQPAPGQPALVVFSAGTPPHAQLTAMMSGNGRLIAPGPVPNSYFAAGPADGFFTHLRAHGARFIVNGAASPLCAPPNNPYSPDATKGRTL